MSRTAVRVLAVGAAAAAALAGWCVVGPLAGVELTVDGANGRTVTVGAGIVVVLSLVAGLAGWALLALLERTTRRARGLWTAIAVVVLILSFAPLADGTIGTGTRVGLGSLHLVVAAVLIPAMRRTARRR